MPFRSILRRQPPHKSNKYFTYEVTVTAGQATTPKFTFTTNVYNKLVDWGDGTIRSVVTTDVELSHTYAIAGKYRITFLMPHQDTLLTQIDVNSDKLSKILTPIQAFRKLTTFNASTNSAWIQNISGWVLPASLVNFYIYSTSVSGDISGWVLPASLVNFYIYSTSVSGDISGWVLPASLVNFYAHATSVSGDISGWVLPASLTTFAIHTTSVSGDISGWVLPASLVNFYIYSTSVSGDISGWVLPASLTTFAIHTTSVSGDISGWVLPASLIYFYIYSTSVNNAPIFTSVVALLDFRYQACALPQATVDLIVSRIYARRASFTAIAPFANVGGTNAAPSGTYADEDPPVTGKGYIYELVNDPEVEGFKKWAITYTA